jgi:MerR family transcriptional regulator, glutamine synthetase repressor
MTQKNIPMKVVEEKTGLTSRQIRYYDKMELIFPERTKGNHRLFSEKDVDRLLIIKDLLEEGYNISYIRNKLKSPKVIKGTKNDYSLSIEDTEMINGIDNKKLFSLYPVSNRYILSKILKEKDS